MEMNADPLLRHVTIGYGTGFLCISGQGRSILELPRNVQPEKNSGVGRASIKASILPFSDHGKHEKAAKPLPIKDHSLIDS
jgi:hypothetical protein